jgi:hypothetical protein
MTKQILSLDECKLMIQTISANASERSRATDRALLAALLTFGGDARTWTWEDALYQVTDLPTAIYLAVRDIATSKRISFLPYNHEYFTLAHWVHGNRENHAVFTVGSKPLTTQEVTRRMKRFARLAGIEPARVSLRTVCNTHQSLMAEFSGADQIADALEMPTLGKAWGSSAGISQRGTEEPVKWNPAFAGTRVERNPRLHGIGRRSALRSA